MLRYPATFGSRFFFNEHLSSDGSPTHPDFPYAVIDRARVAPDFRNVSDPYHLNMGGALGRTHKGMALIELSGRLVMPERSTRFAEMEVFDSDMRVAFDPGECYRDSPDTDGAYALSFRRGVRVDGDAVVTDLVRFARPLGQPSIIERNNNVRIRDFDLALLCPDPRMYEGEERELILTPADPSGDLPNIGNVPAPLQVVITQSGSGDAFFTIEGPDGKEFVLDLSDGSLSTTVILMESSGQFGLGKSIFSGGISRFDLKQSDAESWLEVPPSGGTFTITNTTNITDVTLTTCSAWA